MTDRFSLSGKVAVVTGASKNIGLEICRTFAEYGAGVIMVARDAARLAERAAEIADETGASVIAIPADVTDGESLERLVIAVHELHPQIDVLVNNAYANGATFGVPPLEIEDRSWEETFLGNVLGPYRLIRGFGRAMQAGRGGSIINVLSGSALLPTSGVMPYGSTKAALWMMTRYLAESCAPNIRVNGLCPGVTMSETGGPTGDLADALISLVPMGRAGDPREVAAAALYLASDAAAYTTGALLTVNGGRQW